MERYLLAFLGISGFRLSRRSTDTIIRLDDEAKHGSPVAATHFTQTQYARALGPRNSDLGMLFYCSVAAAAATGLLRRRSVLDGLYYCSALSVGLSVYLLWALAHLRVLCPVCLRGHATNLATFAMLLRMRNGLDGTDNT